MKYRTRVIKGVIYELIPIIPKKGEKPKLSNYIHNMEEMQKLKNIIRKFNPLSINFYNLSIKPLTK